MPGKQILRTICSCDGSRLSGVSMPFGYIAVRWLCIACVGCGAFAHDFGFARTSRQERSQGWLTGEVIFLQLCASGLCVVVGAIVGISGFLTPLVAGLPLRACWRLLGWSQEPLLKEIWFAPRRVVFAALIGAASCTSCFLWGIWSEETARWRAISLLACNLLTFAMLAGYSFLRFKCSPQNTAAEKPKESNELTQSFHQIEVDGQEVTLRIFLPASDGKKQKPPAVVMVCGLLWLGEGLLGFIGLNFNDAFGYAWARQGVPCVQIHTPQRHIAQTRVMELALALCSPLYVVPGLRFLLLASDVCMLLTSKTDIWLLLLVVVLPGILDAVLATSLAVPMLLLGPLGWLVSFAHMAAGLVIVPLLHCAVRSGQYMLGELDDRSKYRNYLNEVPVLGGEQLGSMGSVVCTEEDCGRCKERRGGYRFPWLGRWCKQAVLRREAADPPTAWQEWSNCSTKLDLLQLAMHNSGLQKQDLLPPEWAEVLSRASRFPGCAPVGKVYETWRTWQLGSITWVDPFSVPAPSRSEGLASSWSRAHRSMLAWLDADPEFLLPRTCIVCGDASRNVCGDCMEAVCLDCVANALAQGGPVFGQIFCCSEMAAGEGVRSTAPPLRPSQSRREVAQAIMQFVPPRWAAVTALETAARERVLAWRLEKGLEDDADFAYRWASHEEAIVGAGHAVAHEWLRIRAEQVVTLLPTVAQVMDDLPKPSPSMAPAILRETRGKPKAMASGRRRTGVRLRANPSDAPEAITARVEALTGVMMRLGALAPSGSMTASLQAEWHQACTRLCQRLITNAEKSTVLNALTTAEELRQFMRLRDRRMCSGEGKYAESLKMKHLLLLCSPSIGEFEAWEVIPPSTLREAKVPGRQALDKQIHRDAQTVWAQPISPGEALTKFRLSKNMMSTVANLKLKAAKAAEARAMPATLGNKVLSAFLKNGQALCGAFQIHRCGKEEAQCGALHRCAVVLRSARVCGGKHSACDCYDKRALAAGDTEPPKKEETEAPQAKEERPPQPKKRPKGPEPPDHPPPAKKARGEQPLQNQRDEAKFDRLATSKGRTAQKPTLVLQHPNGGELWLSGLPTVATLEAFPAVSLQVVCFSEPLERRGGVQLPGAQCKTMAPTDKANRDDQWKEVWPLLRQTYFGGEAALIHCMAGRHRAAGITILIRSSLQDCTIEDSDSAISAVRDIEFSKFMSTRHVAEWLWWTYRHASLGPVMPKLAGYMATERSQLHLRTEQDTPLCHHKQSSDKAVARLRTPLRTSSLQEAAQIEDLEELRFFWDTEEKIEPWVQKIGITDETARNIQLARLCRAWSAVRLWYQQAEQDRSKVATADLDTLLQDSSVSREMSKRMLCVFSVWKVRSLQYQLHTTNKKRKLADGLFTEEAEDEHSVAQDWEGYLDKLHTLMIAYSMAGVSAVQGAPAAGGEATLGAASVKFVQAPLDVMLAYFYRAKRTTSLLPVAKRLPWLMMRDAEERAEWVARRRSGKLVAAIAASRVVTVSSSRLPVQPFLQESVVLAFRKFYPESWLVGHKFPMLEDLINQPPFTCYLEWRANNDLSWDGPLNPCLTSGPTRLALRMAEGKQAGAIKQRTPLLSFGLDPDRHFALALQRARVPLPTEALPVLDDDLRFAGACCAEWRGDLRQKRKQAIGALKELKQKCCRIESHNASILRSLKPSRDDHFLLSQSQTDADNGFCTYPMKRSETLALVKNQPHRLIPRCVITQSSGKQRIIDNADVGGQSALSSDANKLVLCSPLRPAQHIAITHSCLSTGSASPSTSGGRLGIRRYSRLVEALGRRFLYLLVSLYFDDAHISDWQSSKGSGQAMFASLNQLLGTPFAQEKRQQMSSEGLFLGLDHDMSAALSSGMVKFWVRERLERKLMDIISTARSTGKLMPGTAAKLYGIANFFEQGGFVIVWLSPAHQTREAFVADIPREVYDLWSPGEKKIAQLELTMVLYGLVMRPDMFRNRRGIWFIDNTAALMRCFISMAVLLLRTTRFSVTAQVEAAVTWAEKNQALLGNDGRLVLCGYSSGGHVASLYGLEHCAVPKSGKRRFEAVVLVSGIYDLRTDGWKGIKRFLAPVNNMIYGDIIAADSDEKRAKASPAAVVQAKEQKDLDPDCTWWVLNAKKELMGLPIFEEILFDSSSLVSGLKAKGASVKRAECGYNHWLLVFGFPSFAASFCEGLLSH
eukprot:symbB.v1.2.034397.t3/scaffold4431.1/size39743/2